MAIHWHISPRIISSLASLYNDTNRVFMEYIDNSLDSAEIFFDQNNAYTKDIKIILKVEGDTYRNTKVSICDNCWGIQNLTKVIQSIWNSDKKNQPWTNGQFWYGIYSFIASCWRLTITSKTFDTQAQYIPIQREQFNIDKIEDLIFPDLEKSYSFPYDSWTIVKLEDFDKDTYKQIDFTEIKIEIEKHFELLLRRKKLEIKIINENGEEYICKPFNYEDIEGDVYNEKITSFTFKKGTKAPKDIILKIEKPVNLFLKITKWKVIDKPPVFISKWRRIWEIKHINSFRSKHKGDIWGHPNLTGYIDLWDFLWPTLARNDFKNNDQSKALFSTLEALEPYILEFIKDINAQSEVKHYKSLEEKLNKILSKLARQDSMNYRIEYWQGSTTNLEQWGWWQKFEEWFWLKDRWEEENKGKSGNGIWENSGSGIWPSWKEWNDTSWWNESWNFASNTEKDDFEESEFKWDEKKKSGFNIRIVDREPQIDNNWKLLRSQLVWWEIIIFRQHSDFLERVDRNENGRWRKWGLKVTQRLVTYLAWEITVHYKDKFQTRNWALEYNKELFTNLVEFIYQFESMLKDLVWTNLSDLSGNNE